MATVAVTGANGFSGSKLIERLSLDPDCRVIPIVRADGDAGLRQGIAEATVVAHLAGVTRPQRPVEFDEGNVGLTERVVEAVRDGDRRPLVLFASSIRALEDTHYGRTKRAAEDMLVALGRETGARIAIFRLGQIFGQGARPYYNAITATILADAARGIATPLQHPEAPIALVDVADVVDAFVAAIARPPATTGFAEIEATWHTTIGTIAELAAGFARGAEPGDDGLARRLYAAWLGYAANPVPAAS